MTTAVEQRPALLVSDSARSAISRLRRDRGPHAILLGWPAGVGYLPAETFVAGECDAIIGHVAGCPVYVDLRDRAKLATARMVIELASAPPDCRTPRLRHRNPDREPAGSASSLNRD